MWQQVYSADIIPSSALNVAIAVPLDTLASKSSAGRARTGKINMFSFIFQSLRWRHNGRDGVSNHQPHDCLLNRLFGRRSKKTSKLRVTGLCVGNSPVTGEFRAQMASDAENVSIWWRHHVVMDDPLSHLGNVSRKSKWPTGSKISLRVLLNAKKKMSRHPCATTLLRHG